MGFILSTTSAPALTSWSYHICATSRSLPSMDMDVMKGTGQVAAPSPVSSCPPCFSLPRTIPKGVMRRWTMWKSAERSMSVPLRLSLLNLIWSRSYSRLVHWLGTCTFSAMHSCTPARR